MLKKFLALIIGAFTLAACSGSDEPVDSGRSIAATWTWDEDNELTAATGETMRPQTLAFFADGTAAIQTIDTRTGLTAYDYYDYRVDHGTFRITRHADGVLFMTGAYAMRGNILTLNNYNYLRQNETDTEGWAQRVIGSWNSTKTLSDRSITTVLTFGKNAAGTQTTFTAFNNLNTTTESEPFNYWIKRNYLIRELDHGYLISTISFGILGNSLLIDSERYMPQ